MSGPATPGVGVAPAGAARPPPDGVRRARAADPATLDRLTSLRALAALSVFAYHLGHLHVWQPARAAAFGYLGVSFFFVLSGFILVWSASPRDTAWRFYRRRFARIYPAYVATLVVACVVPTVAVYRGLDAGMLSATLTQAWAGQSEQLMFGLNGVSWSLSCEAFFYALFPLLLVAMRRGDRRWLVRAVLAGYALASIVVVVACFHGAGARDFVFVNPLMRLPEFTLGMAAGVAFSEGWRLTFRLRAPLVTLVVLCTAVVALRLPAPMMDALLPLGFVAIVVVSASADAAGVRGWLTHRYLVYAGQVSYCFYLVHEMVIVNTRAYVSGPPAVLLDGLVAAAAAVALHHVVELPGQRWLRPGRPSERPESARWTPRVVGWRAQSPSPPIGGGDRTMRTRLGKQ
jgi:peptidoglycan/LPS O-acetylase OafA/YrhL